MAPSKRETWRAKKNKKARECVLTIQLYGKYTLNAANNVDVWWMTRWVMDHLEAICENNECF